MGTKFKLQVWKAITGAAGKGLNLWAEEGQAPDLGVRAKPSGWGWDTLAAPASCLCDPLLTKATALLCKLQHKLAQMEQFLKTGYPFYPFFFFFPVTQVSAWIYFQPGCLEYSGIAPYSLKHSSNKGITAFSDRYYQAA